MKRLIGRKTSMAPSTPITKVEKEGSQDEILKHLERIFSAGSSLDALKIFYAAEKGIESSTQAIKELNLTQKRYYTNLKRLIDVGLVEKIDGKYAHTTLGKIVYKLMEALKGALDQKDKLELVDRLLKAKSLSVEETEEIMRAILKDANIIPGERITDILGPVRMADTWEKVVQDTIEYIRKAEDTIYFASSYFDVRVSEAIAKACERGVKTYLLTSRKEDIKKRLREALSSLLINPHAFKTFLSLLNTSNLKVRYVPEIPYSFFIIDEEVAMVEVKLPYSQSFALSLFFYNRRLCKKFMEAFSPLWERGINMKGLISQELKDLLK